jgi:hypothetical protein
MARMRSLKPEFWHDQEITRLPRDARLLYMAMWNLADEHARLQGDPRFLKGQAFPYDDDLTVTMIDALVGHLVTAGRVERYTVRGAIYLHLPKLPKHQRLDSAKVPSRLPGPEESDPDPDPSEKNPDESEKNPDTILPSAWSPANTGGTGQSEKNPDESGSRANLSALSMLHVAGSKEHVASSREHVAGSMEQGSATRGAERAAPDTAQTIIGEWLDWVPKRPPGSVIGRIGKAIAAMLAERIAADDIRRGLALWSERGLDPAVFPSVVNESMNAKPRQSRAQQETDAMFERAARRMGVTA